MQMINMKLVSIAEQAGLSITLSEKYIFALYTLFIFAIHVVWLSITFACKRHRGGGCFYQFAFHVVHNAKRYVQINTKSHI